MTFLLAVAVVTLLIPVTRDAANRLLDRYVYRTHANYQRTVREASQMLTRLLNLGQLLPFISRTIVTSTEAEGAAIYLLGEDGFARAEVNKRHAGSPFDALDAAPREVIDALVRLKEPLLCDEVARERPTPEVAALHEQLTRTNWSLLLPVLSEDVVIGAIAVGPKLSGDPFYPQDLDLLMTLANQAGIAIKNAQLYAQVVLANEYIENIVATIESGVIAITAAGRIAMFNRAAERLTGIEVAQAKGQAVELLPVCLARALADTVRDGLARTQPEIELPSAAEGPTSRPVICTTSPLRDPAGAVLGAVAVFSDLTPLKELEIERRRAERLAYFEVLASGIAHEIKNPLVAIKTFGQLLPRRHGDEKFVNEFGRVVTREIERMERLLERLRSLSRPGERPRHPIDVRAPLADALESLRAAFDEKSVAVTAALGTEPCLVRGNHGELEQLFLNLLINADEATPPGGTLVVELTRSDTLIAVAVSDTGPGIPPELLERVFDPFFTTKQRGSGLGLALCAGIAETHGARLRAANRSGGGAIFTVEFPLAAVPASVTA